MKIDFFGHPKKTWEELDQQYNTDEMFLIMEDVLQSKSTYAYVFQDLLDIFKYKWEDEKERNRLIHFKFHKADTKVYEIQTRHLLGNLIFWKSLMDVDKVELLDESYIFDFTKFSADTLLEYNNEVLLPINDSDFASQNAMIDDIYHYIVAIAHGFCLLMGMGVSLYQLKNLEERYPEVHDIMYVDVDESKSPKEIEEELKARTDRLIDIIINDNEYNDFKPLFASKSGLKSAQFKEFIIKIGFKADLNGNTIPILINGNFLINGLDKPSSLYINALSGRKSLINVKSGMGRPGFFGKLVSQAATSSILREDNEMCDSVATVDYYINDDNFLSLLDGRYYYDEFGKMDLLDYKKDKKLIGKRVRFRSPATCNSKEGICKYCYGKLYDINKDLFSVGALSALKNTEKISQSQLSTKHNQTTNSSELIFSEGFDDIFEVTSTEISIKEESDLDADLYIKFIDMYEEEIDDSIFYYTHKFDIVDNTNTTLYHIEEEHEAKMYLNDQLIDLYKKLKDKSSPISLETIDDELSLFIIEVKNKEVTEPLKVFQKILNTNDHGGAKDISELCQLYSEALISMGLKYHLANAETIVRSLVRKRSNILEFPEFSRGGNPYDWQIVKLSDALLHNPSPIISMAYGYLRKQLIGTELYEKRHPSHLDTLFVRDLANYI